MKALLVFEIGDKRVEEIKKIEYSIYDGVKHLWIYFNNGEQSEFTFSNDCELRNSFDYEALNNNNVMYDCEEFESQVELLEHIVGGMSC